ncbi:restriction endonuclease subunit S [Methylobacterium sp. 10]|uniref:restriction endonuclease subunit S n=1 Tax=Methylobacterium sp. 10 TaxID=1101191 RepID=UPI0018CC7868|nr:restriction endonuclease subunit S [Methylobacterium sp. 10]
MTYPRFRVADLIKVQKRKSKFKTNEYLDSGSISIIDQGTSAIAGYTNELERAYDGDLPVVIFGDHTCSLKYVDFKFAIGADGTQILRPIESLDTRYMYYALHTTELQQYGYQRHFKLLKECEIAVPPIEDQRRIASILAAYDDLIQVNRRRAVLLEDMARSLFEEWFVRFRIQGHENVAMVDTPDGLVPEGWNTLKVGSVLRKFRRAERVQRQDYIPGGAIPCIDQGAEFIGGYTDNNDALIDDPLPLCVFGDHTRILKFVTFPFASGADGTQLLYPIDGISPEYLYHSICRIDLSNQHYARHFKFLKEKCIVVPPAHLIDRFTRAAKPLMEQVQNFRFQNRALAASRDLLLPRLISGQLSVAEAERQLREAA